MANPCLPGGGDKPISLLKDGRATLLVYPGREKLSVSWTLTPAVDGKGEQWVGKKKQILGV